MAQEERMALEEMAAFFEARLDGYDAHMKRDIESAAEFYAATAAQLPMKPGCRVLDLGCGTGLELEDYFPLNPSAEVTGIDLSAKMLDALRVKFPQKRLTLVQGSYFDVPLGTECYDAAVSVESLHHFVQGAKIALYRKVREALRWGGYFVLTDYMVLTDEEEARYFAAYARLRAEEGIPEGVCCHYDTPLTVRHEAEALLAAGFSMVERIETWGGTTMLRAEK